MPDLLLEIIEPQIKGESKDKDHPDTIEIGSYSFGASQEASMQAGAGLVAGGSSFHDSVFHKKLEMSSIKLFQALAAGARLESAKLYVRRPGEGGATLNTNAPIDYMVYEFEGINVTHFSAQGSSASAIPDESISFAFGKFKKHYRAIVNGTPEGAISVEYDMKKNI
jgi:type VI secretion system secreted protein Hcp